MAAIGHCDAVPAALAVLETGRHQYNKLHATFPICLPGLQSLAHKINTEINVLKKGLNRSSWLKVEHVQSSNLHQLGALVQLAAALGDKVDGVLQKYRDDADKPVYVDIVANVGFFWIKVVCRCPNTIQLSHLTGGRTGERPPLQQAAALLALARQHTVMYTTPQVVFVFCKGVSASVYDSLQQHGVLVFTPRVIPDRLLPASRYGEQPQDTDSCSGASDDCDIVGDVCEDGDGDEPYDSDEVEAECSEAYSVEDSCHATQSNGNVTAPLCWTGSDEEGKRQWPMCTDEELQHIADCIRALCDQSDLARKATHSKNVTNSMLSNVASCFQNTNSPSVQVDDKVGFDVVNIHPLGETSHSYCTDSQGESFYDGKSSPSVSLKTSNENEELCNHKREDISLCNISPSSKKSLESQEKFSIEEQKFFLSSNCPITESSLDIDSETAITTQYSRSSTVDVVNPVDIMETDINDTSTILNDGTPTCKSRCVFLDVPCLMAYVANTSNGHAHCRFEGTFLTQQAAWELREPVRPVIEHYWQGCTLLVCREAVQRFMAIVEVMAGPEEQRRARLLLDRVTVVPDRDVLKNSLTLCGGVTESARIIFGTALHHRVPIITANRRFVRSAASQGIHVAALLHSPRSLTEQKQITDDGSTIFATKERRPSLDNKEVVRLMDSFEQERKMEAQRTVQEQT